MFLGKLQALLDGEDELLRGNLRGPEDAASARSLGARPPAALPGVAAARHAESRQGSGVLQLINAYRVRGHLIADLDPLGAEPHYHPELDPGTYGLTIWDLDREFLTGRSAKPSARASRKRSPRCARSSRRCARPTAARSAAST